VTYDAPPMEDDADPEPRASASSETVPIATRSPKDRRPRVFALGLLIPFVLACSCGGCSLLFRGSVAGAALSSALAARGITCDELSVELTVSLDRATIAPTTCHAEGGSVETIVLVDPVVTDLVLFSPTHVQAGRVQIGLRGEAPPVDSGALGPVASLFRIPERIGLLIRATSEIAAMGPPPIDVTTVEVVRGEHVSVSIDGLALDGGAPLAITAREVTLPGLDGPMGAHAEVRIETLHGQGAADQVTLTGTIHLDGSAPLMGEMHRDGEVTVEGTALTSTSPSYAIRI
jgi:hypothetical protein